MKKIILGCIVIVLLGGLLAACQAKPASSPESPAATAPIVLKAVSFKDATAMKPHMYFVLIDRINARAMGKLRIEYIGGPEAVPVNEQPEALIRGTVDMIANYGASYASRVPEVNLMSVAKLTAWGTHDVEKERKPGGVYDYLRKAHEREGMYFLGRQLVYAPFNIYSKVKVTNMADLAKLTIGGSGSRIHAGFIKGVGASVVDMGVADQYTALERGMIDGGIQIISSAMSWRIYEVAKYVVQPPYKTDANNVYLVNLNTWNKLSKELQDIFQEAAIYAEYHSERADVGEATLALSRMYAAGLEAVELPAAERERYTSIYRDVAWEDVKSKVSAEEYEKMRELAKLE